MRERFNLASFEGPIRAQLSTSELAQLSHAPAGAMGWLLGTFFFFFFSFTL
jgi:hypothetical protein